MTPKSLQDDTAQGVFYAFNHITKKKQKKWPDTLNFSETLKFWCLVYNELGSYMSFFSVRNT